MRIWIAAAIACAGHAAAAAAQTAGPAPVADQATPEQAASGQVAPGEVAPGEIVVTAQKRTERLLDVPMSISAVSGETLVKTGVVSMVNLQQSTPGIVTVNNGFGFLPVIRGIQSTGTSPGDETNVAIYLDDVSIGTPIAGFFDLADIERIEVLKGPQGTLYGRNATGGAVRIVTRKPSFDTSGVVSADYGFHYSEIKASAFLTGKLMDGVAGSLSGTIRRGDGFIDGIATNEGRKYGKPKNYVVRGKLLIEPSSDLQVIVSGDTWKQQNDQVFISEVIDGRNPFPLIPGSIPNAPYTYASLTQPRADLKGWGTSADATWNGPSGITVRSITGYRHVDVHSQSDTDRTNLPMGSNQLAQRQDSFSEELNISGPDKKTLTWIAGAYYYNSKASNPYFRTISGDSPGGTIASNFTNHVKSEAFAGFGEATLNLMDSLHLTGGVRYNSETKTFHWQNLVNTAAPQTDTQHTWNSTTWRAVVRYDFAPEANVYFSASTGFKSGVYNAYSPLDIPVDPEKITAFEVGAKARIAGFNFSLAGYAYKYRGIQVSSYTFVGNPPTLQLTLSNAASAKMRGLEFNVDGRLGGGFSFSGGVSWEPTAKYQKFTSAQVIAPLPAAQQAVPFDGVIGVTLRPFDASGSRTVRTPDVTANARLSYDAPLLGGDLDASINAAYTSEFFWQPGDYSREAPHTIVNFRVGWTRDRITYSVFGTNILATEYRLDLVPNVRGDSVKFNQKQEFGVGVSFAF